MYQKGLGDTLEESEKLLNDFFEAFPKVKKYLDGQVVDALTRGYTQDYYGRIRWYEIPDKSKASYEDVRKAEKSAKRQAQNHGIQALSASVTKMAIKLLGEMLTRTKWGYMILTIHDSIFFEIKTEHLAEAIPEVIRLMEEAAKLVMPKLIAPADYDIGEYEARTDKITGKKFYTYQYLLEDGKIVRNPECISEDTEKTLKQLGVKVDHNDLQGMFVGAIEAIKTQTPEWIEQNRNFYDGIQKLSAGK